MRRKNDSWIDIATRQEIAIKNIPWALGFPITQNETELVTTPFGHFWRNLIHAPREDRRQQRDVCFTTCSDLTLYQKFSSRSHIKFFLEFFGQFFRYFLRNCKKF